MNLTEWINSGKPLNSVINCDCLQGLKQIEDNSIDLVLTDPPYGINLQYDIYQDTEENWFKLVKDTLPEMIRVSKMVIIQACQIKRLKWFYDNFPPDWIICWYKGSVGCSGYVGFNDWEPLLVYGKNNTNMHDYFKALPKPFDNGHPCPKPIGWASWIIRRATNNLGGGDIILDPFLGSGTTAVAAINLGRKFIGMEISQDYCKIAEKRIREAKAQTKLF